MHSGRMGDLGVLAESSRHLSGQLEESGQAHTERTKWRTLPFTQEFEVEHSGIRKDIQSILMQAGEKNRNWHIGVHHAAVSVLIFVFLDQA